MPTSVAELTRAIQDELGLTPTQAQLCIARLVPTFELLTLAQSPTERTSSPTAQGSSNRGGTAAVLTHTQLFNPADSGVLIFLDQIVAGQAGVGDYRITRHDTALTTLQTSKQWTDFRRRGDPLGEMRVQDNATVLGAVFGVINFAGNDNQVVPFPFPVVLPEGTGIIGVNTVLNSACKTWWFWREEPIL